MQKIAFKYPASVIGLSGGIGCGKSTVLRIFVELGCEVIESDKLVHELYNDDSSDGQNFRKAIMERWGEAVITNDRIDRRKIGQIVFNSEPELEWLNSTVHPHVFSKADKIIYSCPEGEIIVFDIPLLFELGIERGFSTTVAVWTNKIQQVKRLRERGWSEKEIEERLRSQLSPDEKLEKANYGIINTGDLNLLQEQCMQLLIKIKKGLKPKGT